MILEIITLLSSTVLGGLFKWIGMKTQANSEKDLAIINLTKTQAEVTREARETKNESIQWTRRILALGISFSVIFIPIVAPIFVPDLTISHGWTEVTGGFWPFTDSKDTMVWHEVQGLVITPMHTQLMAAIAGLYFGGSLVGNRR